ncbi:MAG: hypothetical protein R3F56_01785 [Planctomycetota bacterium]
MLDRFATSIKFAAAACLMTVAAHAQVYIHPDGDTVRQGGHIHVDNWTKGACVVVIKDASGNVIEVVTLPPQGWIDIPVPSSGGLLGQKITTTATSTTGDKAEKTHVVVR